MPFFIGVLTKARSHNLVDLFLVIEARRYESISFSLRKDLSQLAVDTAIVNIICKAIRRMLGGLQDAIK